MFFNLKDNAAHLTITEEEVQAVEKSTGLEYTSLWHLFDRDGDHCATLPEFMDGTKRMLDERQICSKMISTKAAAVRQIEEAVAGLLLIVWVFIAAAVFFPKEMLSIWTALSAGLLSFSFIFSNTVREVGPRIFPVSRRAGLHLS